MILSRHDFIPSGHLQLRFHALDGFWWRIFKMGDCSFKYTMTPPIFVFNRTLQRATSLAKFNVPHSATLVNFRKNYKSYFENKAWPTFVENVRRQSDSWHGCWQRSHLQVLERQWLLAFGSKYSLWNEHEPTPHLQTAFLKFFFKKTCLRRWE